MSQIDKLLSLAAGEIGTKEDKNGRVKYNVEYGLVDAWCVMFIWWLFKHTGLSHLFYDGKKIAGCTALYNWAVGKGLTVSKAKIKRGDLIIFEFVSRKGAISRHIGICKSFDGTYVTTIDGNTCTVGNEADGLEVMERKRHINAVKWVVRPAYEEEKPMLEKPGATYYTVKAGDTFDKIASAHKLTRAKLKMINPQIKDINYITVGQKIRVK